MSEKLVVIPTYNEKENIEAILTYVLTMEGDFHVLVVEDNSPDGTADIVKSLIKKYPDRLFIEERKGKLGLGTAYIHGFKWALNRQYDYIFEMDADFSHNPDDLHRLLDACESGADVAIGSRYVGNVIRVVNWPMGRVMMSYYASKYVRFVTGLKITDSTAGFICYRRKVLETIWFDRIKFIGYAFQIEMKLTASKLGFNVVEVPIVFTDRTVGTSKMTKGIFREAVLGVIKLRFKKILPVPSNKN
ncbi:MAG TPA: polyprenol monophosphomannose synthase [Bacteroidales bacterium]|jgi:dolichol-phosphate mannosyltransferase|nr:polyprenol monophosphomannose synthase [Bacteroidales bacterium]NLH33252.1 polyprenol monophosphomannose synthase [Lentimicrobium sp.]MBP7873961.1 polyprenol monophosphomannose synthase [Bacteroidales bacterium]MCZ2283038.1 polyprenol monophosphomannose synthase [Bacteroidales bacterium]HPX33475.1 polyprenol monophosphomannose synthase [Bacteroidales bacterium]